MTLMAIGILLLLLNLYFLPLHVAVHRRFTDWAAIAILNLFLGWTFIGWVVALVWAFKFDARKVQAAKDSDSIIPSALGR